MRDLGLTVMRGVTGGLMAGHGAQKLFGAFEGPGLQGTAGFMEMLGLRPGRLWGRRRLSPSSGAGRSRRSGCYTPLVRSGCSRP